MNDETISWQEHRELYIKEFTYHFPELEISLKNGRNKEFDDSDNGRWFSLYSKGSRIPIQHWCFRNDKEVKTAAEKYLLTNLINTEQKLNEFY